MIKGYSFNRFYIPAHKIVFKRKCLNYGEINKMVKPNIKAKPKIVPKNANLTEALQSKANNIYQKYGLSLDLSAKPYIKKDGTKSLNFYTITAKRVDGTIAWESVQMLNLTSEGNSVLFRPKTRA